MTNNVTEYPISIIRIDDNEPFIHLGEGKYRTKWGHENGSTAEIPFTAFAEKDFKFLYQYDIEREERSRALEQVKIINPIT